MKCICFNVNSVRTRLHQLEYVVEQYQPDFIGLQETKVDDENFPLEDIKALGYHVEFHGQKSHYGVALMSKIPFDSCTKGFASDTENDQRRFIGGDFTLANGKKISVMNGYFPQGESQDHPTKYPNKRKYYRDLLDHLQNNFDKEQALIVMGDVNVSPEDIDIGIGEDNKKRWLKTGKCSFLPEEREWLNTLFDWGLIDTYRALQPKNDDKFSWFDYRSKGFDREPKRGLRIDLIMATKVLAEQCQVSDIDYTARQMERPSDHCPIWAEFDY